MQVAYIYWGISGYLDAKDLPHVKKLQTASAAYFKQGDKRTALDVLNCAPASPPDGHLYLQVVFEDCERPDGAHKRLGWLGVLFLVFFSLGYPAFVGSRLWRQRELIAEDQLLRAKGVGDDKLTNPHALALRETWGRTYYQFKPDFPLWFLAVIARKFGIAITSIIFNRR